MSDTPSHTDPALDEAAAWHARLNQRTVSHAALAEFRAWRSDPDNAGAYARVEGLWSEAGRLKGDPDIEHALAAVGAREAGSGWLERARTAMTRRPVLGLGMAVIVGAVAFIGLQATMGTTYRTSVGEQRTLRLADGSGLQLDTDSKVRVRLSGDARRIELVRGQAMFEVAHDPSRPFVVSADGTTVRALGTRFEVRRFATGAKVTLVEGSVEVRKAGGAQTAAWSLRPGEQITTGEPSARPRKVDVAAATSWTTGRLVFRDVPLRIAIQEVNRYSADRIELHSQDLGDERVSGVFDADDTEAFLVAVTALHPLERKNTPDGTVVLEGRAGS